MLGHMGYGRRDQTAPGWRLYGNGLRITHVNHMLQRETGTALLPAVRTDKIP